MMSSLTAVFACLALTSTLFRGCAGGVVGKFCVGVDHACMVRASDSSVYCWGGVLSPERGIVAAAVAVACGDGVACALTEKGGSVCWTGASGVAGAGAGAAERVLATPPVAFEQLCVGGGGDACGLLTNGSAHCFNVLGRSPGLAPPAHVGALRSLSCGARHACGIARDGRVVCWGGNE